MKSLLLNLQEKLNKDIDAHIVESIISLFNSGILKAYATDQRHTVDCQNVTMKVSQCVGIRFEGKEKIVELESEIDQLKRRISELEKDNEILLNGAKVSLEYYTDNQLKQAYDEAIQFRDWKSCDIIGDEIQRRKEQQNES